MKKISLVPRSVARFAAVQAVFQKCFTPVIQGAELTWDSVEKDFVENRFHKGSYALFDETTHRIDVPFFQYLLKSVAQSKTLVDDLVISLLPSHWSLDQMEPVTYCLFLCAGCELLDTNGPPKHVVFDEYIVAAHSFLLNKGPGFVNAFLEKFYHKMDEQNLLRTVNFAQTME